MPDQSIPVLISWAFTDVVGQRPDVHRPKGVRPSGLPILSSEPLTTAEKALLGLTAQAHSRLVNALEQALALERVDIALLTMQEAAQLAQSDAQIMLRLGSNR